MVPRGDQWKVKDYSQGRHGTSSIGSLRTGASQFTPMSEEQGHIITHTKKTSLFEDGQLWAKTNTDADVTIGSFSGAETCELDGPFKPRQNLNMKQVYTATTRRLPQNRALEELN
ncbi:hypothetical protein ElyMa_002480700 [Elysia marginata]|uniref:Uncharacterized protein n=1 Tax=Elysia marginata TaxID=1093978 RepID=A0AAV4GPV2_9GAST|nr:hypothetical protein ElyMa_002480700 [Elysia marginata]